MHPTTGTPTLIPETSKRYLGRREMYPFLVDVKKYL